MISGSLYRGERVAGGSALLLLALTFFDWFGSKDSGELHLFSVGRTAWEALDYIPTVLVVTILATLGAIVIKLIRNYEVPVQINTVIATLGLVSAALILFRIIEPPEFGSFREVWGTVRIKGTAQPPIFLAFLAAMGIAGGGYWAIKEARVGR